MWDHAGMARNEKGLKNAIADIQNLNEEFHKNLFVTGNSNNLNSELEEAGRVRDFIEFGELLCRDALAREESCGGHFREEYQTDEGEAKRNDKDFANASVWKFNDNKEPILFQEDLNFENIELSVRSYK